MTTSKIHQNDKLFNPNWETPTHIKACITTSKLGNITNQHVAKNLENELNLNRPIQWLAQTHSTDIVNLSQPEPDLKADGSFTNTANQVCAIRTADCVPLLFFDQTQPLVGAIHAGWRGLYHGILENSLDSLEKQGIAAHNLNFYIGPCIQQDAYCVSQELAQLFKHKFISEHMNVIAQNGNRTHINLPLLAQLILNKLGVRSITQSSICTTSTKYPFYSYRRDKHTSGGFASLIWIEST